MSWALRQLTRLTLTTSLVAHLACSANALMSRSNEAPTPPADPSFGRQFKNWLVMHSVPGEPILATTSSQSPRSCIPGEAQPIAQRTWYERPFELGKPHAPKLVDRLHVGVERYDREPYFRQRLFAASHTLTVLTRTGETRTITFNAVDSRLLPDGFQISEFCHYHTIDHADRFSDPHASPLFGDDDDDLYKKRLEMVVVSTVPTHHRLSARAATRSGLVAEDDYERNPIRQAPKTFINLLRRKDVAAFLASDRANAAPIDTMGDLRLIGWQQFDITLDPRRSRERVWSITYFWKREGDAYASMKLWGLFTGSRAIPRTPLFLWKSDEVTWEQQNSGDFSVDFVADLNGDGVEEIIVRRSIFEGYGDAILAWSSRGPVVIYEDNDGAR